jgi:hypothetical protein
LIASHSINSTSEVSSPFGNASYFVQSINWNISNTLPLNNSSQSNNFGLQMTVIPPTSSIEDKPVFRINNEECAAIQTQKKSSPVSNSSSSHLEEVTSTSSIGLREGKVVRC